MLWMIQRLVVIIPYFGQWPEWINLFVETCKWNPDIHWRFYTDCGQPENKATNIHYSHLGFDDYKAIVRQRLRIDFDPSDPYKLCDLKPSFGTIHERDIEGYDFFGFGDIDVIYGRIRDFYNEKVLDGYDVISTHANMMSGHLAFLRNTKKLRQIHEHISDYKKILENPDHTGIDEMVFANVIRKMSSGRLLFVERYSTVLSPLKRWHDGTMNYPHRWYWIKGHLTNERDGEREFLYLHFMRWRSLRYMLEPKIEGEGAWLQLNRLVNIDWQLASSSGFCISREGFLPIAAGSLEGLGRPNARDE
jgi:hypothetical protein